jgi:sugar lactone lactonase YvrE
MDSAGNLYVPDSSNYRVLQFQPPFSNGMNASVAIGQPTLTAYRSIGSDPEPSAGNIGYPASVALDSQGNLWVADNGFSRVLEYVPPFTNGMSAKLAIGQPSTSPTSTNPCNQTGGDASASTLCFPTGVTFDSKGNLWVSDSGNSRVLEYVPPFSTGMAASLELGQPAAEAFTANQPNNGGTSASSLYGPTNSTFDSSGNLWVTDGNNFRVLEYVPPFTNGMAASTVIGQVNFTGGEGNGTTVANVMVFPFQSVFDSSGNLIVTDAANNRALIFAPPFSNGMNATTVLGEPNFTSELMPGSPAANTLNGPCGLLAF